MKTLHMISLGCPKNLVDSEVMLGSLEAAGYRVSEDPAAADVLLVNTCGFIQSAVEEGIEAIMELLPLKQQDPGKLLVVTGCMVQRYGDALVGELPEVDLFIGTEGFHQIVLRIDEALHGSRRPPLNLAQPSYLMDTATPRRISTPAHRAWLKITEGCNNRCSYCMIPAIRGPLRSRSLADLVAEAQRLEAGGVRELTLIAQDTTAYGIDLIGGKPLLSDLLHALLADTAIPWIRMLYLQPKRIDDRLLRAIAEHPRLLPYFDIPLQHISGRILQLMNRHYDRAFIDSLLTRVRETVAGAVLRTSLMVGFPGEGAAEFAELEEAVHRYRFDHLGVFAYSNEEGCRAATLADHVGDGEKERRRERIMTLQAAVSAEKNREKVGRHYEVLVEGLSRESDLLLEGRTREQAPEIDGCVYITDGEGRPGELVTVRITEAHPYDLVGEIVADGGGTGNEKAG
ncbi:MAG: 30S ribosomal protein S12 methylthiotransferase RimO [Thermodesulfobacteriota bacterium]